VADASLDVGQVQRVLPVKEPLFLRVSKLGGQRLGLGYFFDLLLVRHASELTDVLGLKLFTLLLLDTWCLLRGLRLALFNWLLLSFFGGTRLLPAIFIIFVLIPLSSFELFELLIFIFIKFFDWVLLNSRLFLLLLVFLVFLLLFRLLNHSLLFILRTVILRFDIWLLLCRSLDLIILLLQSDNILLFLFLSNRDVFYWSFWKWSFFLWQIDFLFFLSFFLSTLGEESCHDIRSLLRYLLFNFDWLLDDLLLRSLNLLC
jgi:hypothetical protein